MFTSQRTWPNVFLLSVRFFFVCIVWIEEAEANYSLVVLCRCIFCVSTVNCTTLQYLCCVLHALHLYLCCSRYNVADTTSANYKVVEEALSPPSMASIERHTRLFQRRIEGFDPCCSSFYKETHWRCKGTAHCIFRETHSGLKAGISFSLAPTFLQPFFPHQ